MTRRVFLIVFLIITVLWTAFIFSNSLDNGTESTEKSSSITELVNELANAIGVKKPIKESTVRAFAHFGEFSVLALLCCADILLFLSAKNFNTWHSAALLFLSVPFCTVIACTDEFIQSFSDGRTSQLSDVLTDTSGAFCGAFLFAFFYIFFVKFFHKTTK